MYKMEILLALWKARLKGGGGGYLNISWKITEQELFFDDLGRVWEYKLY